MRALNFRKKALHVLFVGLLLCLSLVILPVAFSVKATTDYSPKNGIAQAGFYMDDGAEVRLFDADGKQGIRFVTNVEKGFYDYLKSEYGDATIEFHTLVNYDGLAIEEIDRENSQDITLTATPHFDKDEPTSTFVYRASIIYNGDSSIGVSEETKREAYSLELTARAYVVVDGKVIYAKCGDTARSMKGVASAAYLTEEDDLNKAVLESYMTPEGSSINDLSSVVNGYYGETYVGGETYDKTAYAKQGLISIPQAKIVEAYLGAIKLDLTEKEDGSAVISGYEFDETAITKNGKDVLVTAYDEDGNAYLLTCKLATRVLTVAEDLNMFQISDGTEEFSGLYVLGNDIDATGYNVVTHTNIVTLGASMTGLTGTFDGNGYTISNLNLSSTGDHCNLFGRISNGGVVKNVAIKAVISGEQKYKTLFAYFATGMTMTNVYVDLDIKTGGNYTGGLFSTINGYSTSTIKNCVFNVHSDITTAVYYRGSLIGDATTPITDNWANVYMISPMALGHNYNNGQPQIIIDAENCENGTVKNVKRYDTIDNMSAANNDYSSFVGVWKLVDGIPVWHDTKVVKELATTYNYSQTEQALDLASTDEIYGYTEVESLTTGYTAELVEGKLVIAKDGATDFTAAGEEIKLVAYKDDIYYQFTVKVCTSLISEASDLAIFNLKSVYTAFPGYYMLTKSFDCGTYVHASHVSMVATDNPLGLTGTFDGNGYTISGLNLSKGMGLFGGIHGGTIKNIAFVDAKISGATRDGVFLGRNIQSATITDTYFDIEMANTDNFQGALAFSMKLNTISRCIVEVNMRSENPTHYRGSLFGSADGYVSDYGTWSDFYVISEHVLSKKYSSGDEKDAVNCGGTVKNVERYTSDGDMSTAILKAENKDARLAAFDNGYWNVDYTTGAITFKTK